MPVQVEDCLQGCVLEHRRVLRHVLVPVHEHVHGLGHVLVLVLVLGQG